MLAVKSGVSDVAERFRVLCEMIDVGLDIQRQNLRRAHPDWSDQQIEAELLAWRARTDQGPASGE